MTLPHSESDDSGISDQLREQCLLYLLGELDLAASTQFEKTLQSSPQLASELAEQARMLTVLASERGPARPAVTPLTPSAALSTSAALSSGAALSTSAALSSGASSNRIAWSWWASAIAVAACLTVMVLGMRSSEPTLGLATASEDLLIARAWADHRLMAPLSESMGADPDQVAEFDALADDPPAELDSDDEFIDRESALSWMYTAVLANLEPLPTGAASDG